MARGRFGESFEGVMLAGEGVGIEFWMGVARSVAEGLWLDGIIPKGICIFKL
jgi:hypothetical protein